MVVLCWSVLGQSLEAPGKIYGWLIDSFFESCFYYICITTSLQVAIIPGVGPLEWSLMT
jgi:hypothetical protein